MRGRAGNVRDKERNLNTGNAGNRGRFSLGLRDLPENVVRAKTRGVRRFRAESEKSRTSIFSLSLSHSLARYPSPHTPTNPQSKMNTVDKKCPMDTKVLDLIRATRRGHADVVRRLLKDPSVDPSANGNRAMNVACQEGHLEIVQLLLQDKRVDPAARRNHAILEAAQNGHEDVVRLLLQDSRVDPSDNDNEAIIMASEGGYLGVVRILLQDSRVDPSCDNNRALRYAVISDHKDVVRLLLQDPRVDPSDRSNSAIRCAAREGHEDIVRILLQDKRVDPSDSDNYAIEMAATEGRTNVVRLLLQDPRVDPSDNDNQAIQLASREGYLEIVRLLLQDKRVDPSSKRNNALRQAANVGHADVVRLLLCDERVSASDCNPSEVTSPEIRSLLMRSKRFCQELDAISGRRRVGRGRLTRRILSPEENLHLDLCLASPEDLKPLQAQFYKPMEDEGQEQKTHTTATRAHTGTDTALSYVRQVCDVLLSEGDIPFDISAFLMSSYVIGCTDK